MDCANQSRSGAAECGLAPPAMLHHPATTGDQKCRRRTGTIVHTHQRKGWGGGESSLSPSSVIIIPFDHFALDKDTRGRVFAGCGSSTLQTFGGYRRDYQTTQQTKGTDPPLDYFPHSIQFGSSPHYSLIKVDGDGWWWVVGGAWCCTREFASHNPDSTVHKLGTVCTLVAPYIPCRQGRV